MKINIKGTGIELTPAITSYVEKKISAIEKYTHAHPNVVVQVEVGKQSQHHKSGDVFHAEVHLIGEGLDLYAASNQSDLYAAIDLVKDEVVQKLVSGKDKSQTLMRRGAQRVKNMMRGFNPFKKDE